MFLKLLAQLFPNFKRSLALVLPVYKLVYAQLVLALGPDHERVILQKRGGYRADPQWADLDEQAAKPLKEALLSWATRFNLEREEWVLDEALRTLGYWASGDLPRLKWVWPSWTLPTKFPVSTRGPSPVSMQSDEKRSLFLFRTPERASYWPLSLHALHWNPAIESEEDYRIRAMKELDSYIQAVKSWCEQNGWTHFSEPPNQDHFISFALFHVGSRSYGAVADWWRPLCKKDLMVIKRGIVQAARALGMTLRSGRRGPNRK